VVRGDAGTQACYPNKQKKICWEYEKWHTKESVVHKLHECRLADPNACIHPDK